MAHFSKKKFTFDDSSPPHVATILRGIVRRLEEPAKADRAMGDLIKLAERLQVRRQNQQQKVARARAVKDTGGGCSVCGDVPAVNLEGTYWLCGPCVLERVNK